MKGCRAGEIRLRDSSNLAKASHMAVCSRRIVAPRTAMSDECVERITF